MKISINDKEIFTVGDTQKAVMRQDPQILDLDITYYIWMESILKEKYERCWDRLKRAWLPKLRERGIESIPTSDEDLAKLIFSQPDYKDRRTLENESGREDMFRQIHAREKVFHPDLKGCDGNLATMPWITLKCDGQVVFEMSPVQQKVILNDIHGDIFYADLCRRVHYILDHPYRQRLQKVADEWIPKLRDRGVKSIPLDDEKLAEMVLALPY